MEDTMMYERLSNPQQTCKTNDRKKQFQDVNQFVIQRFAGKE
jgi:hypothetical protein